MTILNAAEEKPKKSKYAMCNPVIRKMAKKTRTMTNTGEAASYKGIASKTVYFLALCIVGIVVFFLLHNVFMNSAASYGGTITIDNLEGLEGIISINTCAIEGIVFLVAGVIVLFAPLLAWLIRPIIPVVGTLYALCEGYFVGMLTANLGTQYKWIPFVAFILTAAIVSSMLILYVKRIIKVTEKFKKIILTLFITIISGGILMVLLSFVPFLNPIISGIMTFMNNPIVSIVCSVIFIVIASLFLLYDFDAIEMCVKNNMPKKMEWMAAFGLVYTVIYIYFKIINLLIRIAAQSKK